MSVPDCGMDKLSILSNLHSSSFLLLRLSRRSPKDRRLLRSQEAQSGRGIRIHKLGRETIFDQCRWQLFLVVSVKLFSENLTRDALTFQIL